MMSIRQTAFLDFVGKEDNLEHVNSYWTANSVSKEAQDNIRLIEFRKLVYWICSKREFVLKDFLEERIPVAETIVSSFNIAVAYYKNFCAENITISQSYPASERRYIRQSDILDFLGEEKGNVFLRRLKEYRTVNPVSEKQRDKISFEEFRGIMKLICSKQQFDLKDFLDKRREAVVVI
ncbi:uncharacterized protein LOC126837646 [Adelges cooleyi]|uniref:uncharacterized protein LOC126837646 n=1 Tax=Adelges cooleyi TaxID=133065 RepID=UPI00218046C6|nr:uncharacterized protein LOC126837646 [Adelges cooleyi]